ncbi:MAG: DNA topoisomerase VI subunit B [Candidatus Micrarchaeota archaeon]|nr:DNA topoisomerase VI subunit B [Candidatus Micrarchaeota archaeon]
MAKDKAEGKPAQPAAAAAKEAAKPAAPAAAAEKAVSKSSDELEREFREYSVAEFFKRNRQMLGYTGKVRSLTTIVHEVVTNSLDSAEDAGVPPEILVEVSELPSGHYKIVCEDNGTGVPKSMVGQAFGKLLAGTKFHKLVQKRGQQGIGVSYAVLFSQITTGKTTHVKTGIGDGKVFECDLSIDVKKNDAVIVNQKEFDGKFRGVRIESEFSEVTYNRSEHSVYEYLRRTAIANPHAQITLIEPDKNVAVFPRATKEMPKKPEAILPHPLGMTTSDLIDMAHTSKSRKLSSFFTGEFSRFSSDRVKELQALVPEVNMERAPATLTWPEAEKIVQCFHKMKWIAPDMGALRPIGEKQIEKSMKNMLQPEEMRVVERKPKVFRGGIPFVVEAGVAFGGKAGTAASDAPGGRKAEILRFANRTPLLFDAGNCAITEAVNTIDWNRYDLKDFENQPVTVFVNFVSVYVPYTGAGKLAISAEDEIVEEIRMALMECARNVSNYIHALRRAKEQEQRRSIFTRYVEEIAQALHDVTGKPKTMLADKLRVLAKEKTALLDSVGEVMEDALEEVEEAAEEEMEESGENPNHVKKK